MKIYTCDRCGERVMESGDLLKFNLSKGNYNLLSGGVYSEDDVDLCPRCCMKLDALRDKVMKDSEVLIRDWFAKGKNANKDD